MRRRHSSRYFLARFRPLSRPIFWGPAIALLLLMLFTWDFWTSPNVRSALGLGSDASVEEEEVTPDEKAIGADIDSTSVLMNDIGISAGKESPQAKESPVAKRPTAGGTAVTAISSRYLPEQIAPNSTPQSPQATPQSPQGAFGVFNSALAERYGLTNGGSVMGDSAAGNSAIGNNTPTPTLPAQSPLQSAVQRMQSSPGVNAAPNYTKPPVEGSAPVPSPSVNAAPDSANSYTNLMGGSRPLQNYSTVPAPGSALPSLSPAPIPSSFGQPSAPQPGNFGVQSPAPTLNQQPFSTPRSIPGRSIGGGNINTFSNP